MPDTERKVIGISVEKAQQILKMKDSQGRPYACDPVRRDGRTGDIIAWEFPCSDGSVLRAPPTANPWVPHERATWPHRYMTTKVPVNLRIYNNKEPSKEPAIKPLPIGTRVKIVMVSRFGDVGITDDLTVETGYHARININELEEKFENFSMDP